VFGFFQKYCWSFLAFFIEDLAFFEKINLATLLRICFSIDDRWSVKQCRVSAFKILGPTDF